MPPSTWMQSLALAWAASIPEAAATAAATDSCSAESCPDSPAARAASAADTDTCSERSSISAHMCLMAWKLPIGLPNCSRTLAYSVAMFSAHRASPAASAASTVAARSSNRCRDAGSTRAGADSSVTRASGTEKSVASSGSHLHPVGRGVDQQHPLAGRQQQHPGRVGAEHLLDHPGDPVPVDAQLGPQRGARGAFAGHQRFQDLGVVDGQQQRRQRGRRDRAGHQGRGGLVEHAAQIGHGAAGSAELLGDRHTEDP